LEGSVKLDWRQIDEAVRVEPGKVAGLARRDPVSESLFTDKGEARKFVEERSAAIDALQDRLWAERSRALLVVLQGMDTSGKDGTVRAVFNACGPIGVRVTAFGRPSEVDLAHDYLWRVHAAAPAKGTIGVFNRSHYEDVLVVRVRGLAPAAAIERRYDQINAFEKHLAENGTTILKFMLHITKEEQAVRLQARLDDPAKHWKFNPADLEDRALWKEYEEAYEAALTRCSTVQAPWRIVPADKKWRRNAIVAAIVHGVLEEMDPRYPGVSWKPEDFKLGIRD
jgi:PPK2 family polyphosphate:nucleotide phosphotransferase